MRSRELYTPVHVDFPRHPKTLRLTRLLGVTRIEAMGHVLSLWLWSIVYTPGGDVTDHDASELADVAEWKGDPTVFVDALLLCGKKDEAGYLERTLDGRLLLHEVDVYMGPLIKKRTDDAARLREKRAEERKAAEAARLAAETSREASLSTPSPESPHRSTPAHDARGDGGQEITPERGSESQEALTPVKGVESLECRATVARQSCDVATTSRVRGEKRREEERRERETEPPPAGGASRKPRENPKDGPLAAYCSAWAKRYGGEPLLSKTDCLAVNRALLSVPETERSGLLTAWVEDSSPKLVENAHPLSWFIRDINRIRARRRPVEAKPSKYAGLSRALTPEERP